MKKILVFVVRHGEREDEALARHSSSRYKKMEKQDKIDPRLTPEGHHQAFQAFDNILTTMEIANINKVAVFSSPLRRAIGTSMMLSAAVTARSTATNNRSAADLNKTVKDSSYSKIQFVLPSNGMAHGCTQPSSIASSSSNGIPVVVHNDLANCTGLVSRFGGIQNLVRAKQICCANMPRNTINHEKNFHIRHYLKDINKMAQKNDEIHVLSQSTSNQASIQLWRVHEGLDVGSATFVPMAPPTSLSTEDNTLKNDNSIPCSYTVPASYDIDGQDPIDRVVRMAMDSSCDACIVSSHREEIWNLFESRCGCTQELKHIPYCSIGVFEAFVDADSMNNLGSHYHGQVPLQWIFHELVTPGNLPPTIAKDILALDQQHVANTPFHITYPVIERTTLFLCQAKLLLDSLAGHHSVTSVKSATLTGMLAQTALNGRNSSTVELHLKIVGGHQSWRQFLNRLHNDVAIGSIEYYCGQVLRQGQLLVRPSHQPPLPCPQKIIVIEILPLLPK